MRFAKFIFSVLIICLVVMALLEYAYRNYSTWAARIFIPYYRNARTIETIYIGNSHMEVLSLAISEEIKTVGNLSLGGQDIFLMYAAIKTVIPKSPALKKIYLGLDYDLIGYNQTKSGQEYIDRDYYEFTGELYNNTLTNRLMSRSNFFRSNRNIEYLFNWNLKKNKRINFIPLNSIPMGLYADTSLLPASPSHRKVDSFMCRKRAEEHSILKFKRKNISENLEFLERIVLLCTKYKIEIILVNPPKPECYKNFCNKDNIIFAKHVIDSFTSTNKIQYLDFYNDTAFFNDDLYVDDDHLNAIGAKIFCDKLFSY